MPKHAGGRPTDYTPEVINKLEEYLSQCGREQTELPTVEGFALYIDVDTDTINNWADKKDDNGSLVHPEFFGAYKKLFNKQKNQLINDGLYGGKEINTAMAIFLLKVNHNMVETNRTELTGKGGVPLLSNLKDVHNNDSTSQTEEIKQEN